MLSFPIPLAPGNAAFRVGFVGAPALDPAAIIRIDAPWLAGTSHENLFPLATPRPSEAGVQLFEAGDLLLGYAHETLATPQLAAHAEALYRRVLGVCHGHALCRVWNYVPQINAHVAGSENYRAFCLGRARAFEQAMGPDFEGQLPAASAVGSRATGLDLIFVANKTAPRHFENPEQVPAYRYPIEHGPRSPSFARATVTTHGAGQYTFVSGTAAIKGHQTIAPGDLAGQLDCTLDNLRLISRAAGMGDRFHPAVMARRHFKIYLRNPNDLRRTQTRLEAALLQPEDTVIYLQADICRAALNLEIEATIVQPNAGSTTKANGPEA